MSNVNDTPVFPRGFKTPFNCPLGVVHEVYRAEPCGTCGCIVVDENGKATDWTATILGTMYSITAEIEVLDDESREDFFAFAKDAMGYLAANPHRATKRIVTTAWVTDDTLIEQDASA